MGLSTADHLALLQALLPGGPAWADGVTRRQLQAWGDEYTRLDARVQQLLEEADTRFTAELLTDWERLLGLPDKCSANLVLSTDDRRRLATARLTEQGGQSRTYFIGLAARYGEAGCTITEFRQMTCNSHCNAALHSQADEFVWRVNVPRPVDQVKAMTCNDNCNSALASYNVSLAECPIQERKPAHTNVIFKYAA